MKILYSCLSRSWGGMEMVTLTSIKQLLKRNIEVELLCYSESRLHIEANNLGIVIYPLKASGYFHPVTSLRITNLIRKGNYDLIHTQASKDLWVLVPSLDIGRSNKPLILTKHVGSFVKKTDPLHQRLYNRLTFVIAISNVIKKNLLDTTPLTEDKIILLHNGIDTKEFNPVKVDPAKVRNEFSVSDNEILIGMLARFSPGKGHEDFLEAAQMLNKKYDNLKFMIVGEASRGEEAYEEEIKKLADDYGLNNIIFTGFRSDTPDVLAAMDIFVFPSHAEAFGIALVEAMAMGIPSVCSDSDGIPDVAVDSETSYFFSNKNPSDLKAKIKKLIDSPDARKTMGIAARKRAVEKFEIENLTEEVIDIYKQAVKKQN